VVLQGLPISQPVPGGRNFEHRPLRLRALIFLMRWSGLCILYAITLERRRLEGNRLFLYRHNTGVPVYVPIPPALANLLNALPNSDPRYFFRSGNGDPHTAKKGWQRTLGRLFETVALKTEDGQPKRCHPHMFRDSFAVELLLAGALLDQVHFCSVTAASRSRKSITDQGFHVYEVLGQIVNRFYSVRGAVILT
jgi:integrase/recombinase XerD